MRLEKNVVYSWLVQTGHGIVRKSKKTILLCSIGTFTNSRFIEISEAIKFQAAAVAVHLFLIYEYAFRYVPIYICKRRVLHNFEPNYNTFNLMPYAQK